MTWSRFDDCAATHPKARLAGNEAWSLWQAAIQYCNRYLTDGVVPLAALAVDCLPEPISMAKAKKLADRLVGAKVRDDGHGLFEALGPNKFAVHDFLDWNPSKEQVEAKRKADRDRKRGGPESGGQSGAPPPRIPLGIPTGKLTESRPDSASREGARVPAQPAVPSPPSPSERAAAGAAKGPRPLRIRRFPDFQPTPEHVDLAMRLGADVHAEAAKFRDHEFRDPKSDANACFRTWLKRSIELRRAAIGARLNGGNGNRAADGLEAQLARIRELEAAERQGGPAKPLLLVADGKAQP